MRKKLLMVLFPVLLMVAGSLAVWANEQGSMPPGCNKCAQMEKKSPCTNCPNAAKMEQGCANCPNMNGAEASPAGTPGCNKCAKVQQPQPAPKRCCEKPKSE